MQDPFQDLIRAYDRAADERDRAEIAEWKQDLRRKLLDILTREGKSRLIDIGAGPGLHGKFFQDQGLRVTCVDLAPANIEKCLAKGLEAHRLNLLELEKLSQSFDCAFAFNSLLHIPSSKLPEALGVISRVIEPGGLFFWGQYGGECREGIYQDDSYQPKRFFALLTDDQIKNLASAFFMVEQFQTITPPDSNPLYFQVLLLRQAI